MSKDNSSLRFVARNPIKSTQSEGNENEFENLSYPINFPHPRTPLNSIPDPSQFWQKKESHERDNETAVRAVRLSDLKFEGSDHHQLSKRDGNVGPNYENSRGSNRGKTQSEPNSAHSTPARRVSSIGALGPSTGSRAPLYNGEKGGSSSRVSRGLSVGNSEVPAEYTHFELEEDPLFWNDHNVQTLIRIRPLSNMEKVTQGYGRCLKQESPQGLTWLGHPELRFTFDHVACETISQEKLFRVAGLPMVDNCMSGYNSCMFAYGQTGSGKTYTMMGDIGYINGELNKDCGITPRIFEYLFTRIEEEEESRRDERLNYSCKCSFLEIYNEQITDLLEPSSTNLQLREDLKKGVYVENLKEYNVRNVGDVLKLLLQGAANRKMAATHMNSESSRSHSVFTCIIESHWEKDSMTHLRFGRLNLVDLAGSERQKSSGAEGDRLKEAANINKSLSTLGLVIMSLVDLAHGKQRHVPYRDSRLTFLLQDSLGGNSKTTIIANVSPSICSASETLSTLKFAQRAKLIQNNAKVNEDASGDVTALQRQIQQLKGQLSFMMKSRNNIRFPSYLLPGSQNSSIGGLPDRDESSGANDVYHYHNIPRGQSRKMKCLEATLVGALRREKFSETEVRRLEAEIAQLNRLVQQREEDALLTKMMLKDYEEKFKRVELLADGLVSADEYLADENQALIEEIELLRARVDRNPELTRFALENMRLLEQLRLFQDFYEQGERETLLAEVSELRDKLLEALEAQENFDQHKFLSRREEQDNAAVKELEECKSMNAKLIRELEVLQNGVRQYMSNDRYAVQAVETISTRSDSGDKMSSSNQEDGVQQNKSDYDIGATSSLSSSDLLKELMDAKILMQALETEQVRLIEELQIVRQQNHKLIESVRNKDKVERQPTNTLDDHCMQRDGIDQNLTPCAERNKDINIKDLQVKLNKMTDDLEEAQFRNSQYLESYASQLSRKHESELICEEVEMEATKTILHLQEEMASLQSEFQDKLFSMADENHILRIKVAEKEDEMKKIHAEWGKASLELTNFILDGCKSLADASRQIEYISCSFPDVNVGIREHIEKAAEVCVEKEETIMILEKSLEDAQMTVLHMEQKLISLKSAAVVLTEVHQPKSDAVTNIEDQLTEFLDKKFIMMESFENKLIHKEDQITEANKRANAAFLALRKLSGYMKCAPTAKAAIDSLINASHQTVDINHALLAEDTENHTELARLELQESEGTCSISYSDEEMYLSSLQTDIQEVVSLYREVTGELMEDIQEMKKTCVELKENCRYPQLLLESLKDQNDHKELLQIIDELAEINDKLNIIRAWINTKVHMSDCSAAAETILEVDGLETDSSILDSNILFESFAPKLDESSIGDCYGSPKLIDQTMGLKVNDSVFPSSKESEYSERFIRSLREDQAEIFWLRKEFGMIYNAFIKLNVQLVALFKEKEIGDRREGMSLLKSPDFLNKKEHVLINGLPHIIVPMLSGILRPSELVVPEASASCSNKKELVADGEGSKDSSFSNKFEEARATMQEADIMLNALLKANENSRQLTGMWKQAGEDLMLEKTSMLEEIEQLKSSIHLKDGENELMHDQIHQSFTKIANLISLLEGSFLHMQKDMEDMCKEVYSDVLMTAKEIMSYICFSRSSVEDIFSKVMEKEFDSFVIHQCSLGEVNKFRSFNKDLAPNSDRLQDHLMNHLGKTLTGEKDIFVNLKQGNEEGLQNVVAPRMEAVDVDLSHDDTIHENLRLRNELDRKEVLLKGLLFDFSLLQESASTKKDLKAETENLVASLRRTQHELEMKTSQLNNLLVENRKLECRLSDAETALFASNSDLEQAKGTLDMLSNQHAELKVLLGDLYHKKSEAEEQLEEQIEVVKTLEKEILLMTSSAEQQLYSSLEDIKNDLSRVTEERDQLHEQIVSLQDRVDMAYALADENEAIAVEARQELEANKMFAEQKEEEVKILEHSVEELECTINVLEKKVYDMEEEVERHRMIRDSLELELKSLRQRLLTVETFTENWDSENSMSERPAEDQLSRKLHNNSLELHEAREQIKALEKELEERTEEIKQSNNYISELVLHAEAQASQYQHKYKILEEMVREVKIDSSNVGSADSTLDKTEKSSTRARGSNSPFRCIGGLVQQMNLEKDQELSAAKRRIEELDTLLASRQKEVCMLNTRLAAAESMTHDVIRDLLGVKLDMTNYANLMDQYQLRKLVEEAQQQAQLYTAMEKEILNLRRQIDNLIEERERCIFEVNKREADIFTIQMTIQQIEERDQLLIAQNEMLKADKTNLQKKVAELDDMVKKLCGTQTTQPRVQQQIHSLLRLSDTDLSKRLTDSAKQLARVNDELSQYYKSESNHPHAKFDKHGSESKIRKYKS